MYFTQEDYKCIQNWLQRHAVKDTEIPLTDEIHSNKDSLVIVQNNKNYRIGAIRFLSTVIDNAELNSLSLKTLNADLANVKKLIVESFETKGELIDGYGNNLNDTTEAAKGWSIKQIEPTSEETNVVTKYALTDYNGEYKGDFVKIYKNGDTFVADVYSGTTDDTVDNKTGIPNKKPITESNKALCVILHNDIDSYTISHIPSNTFIDFNFLKVWTGSNAISKLGTIAEGVWEGTPIADAFIASANRWNSKQDALTDTDGSYGQRIKTIESKIPSDTTVENPLANKEFVNSSIATNTATFRGTYTNVNQFPLTGVDDNDYVFLKVMDTEEPTQVLRYDRYKWNGTGWTFEYSLNNSSFTSEQWTAINSGITPELIETFNNKQDLIPDLDEIRDNANKGAIAYSWSEHISTFNEFKWNEDHTAIYIGDENNPISFYAYGSISAGGFNNTSGTGGGTVIGIKIGDSDPITPIDGILNVPSDVISRSLNLKALAFKDVLSASDIPTLDISKINGLQSALNAFNAHIDNKIIHITADERTTWSKIASLFGIDDSGDIYIKPDANGRDRGFYTSSFISSGGKSNTPGTGGGTVVGATINGAEVPLLDGILAFPPYPTAKSLGLGNIAFKNSLVIADIANLQSDLDNKQQAISVISANLSSHIGDSTIHITANERNAWNKVASLFGVDENNDIYVKNGKSFYTEGFISAGGKSETQGGAGGGTVTGIKIGAGDIITPIDGILNIPDYPTTISLGLKALAFKDALSANDIPTLDISKISGLQTTLDRKQNVISDLATIRSNADNGNTAYLWGDHSGLYLPLSGGTMSNTNVVTNLNADLLDGHHHSSFAKVESANNLIFAGNEFTIVPSAYAGEVFINFRTAGGLNGAISKYSFFDGSGNELATISDGQFSGNAATSSKWATPRTITLTGSVTGSMSIDGSGDVSLATTTNHTHTFASLTSKPTTISGYGITDALTTANYNSYAPTLTGAGASGTWGISISGNAESATRAARLSVTWGEDPNYTSGSNLKLISNSTGTQGNYPNGYSSGLSVMTDYVGWQMMSHGGDIQNPYFRSYQDNGTWKPWKQLAFLTDNVASATQLQNARTIWGQSFNGTANVSGALSEVTDITASGTIKITSTDARYLTITGGGVGFHTYNGGWDAGYKLYDTNNSLIGFAAGAYGEGNTLNYYYYGGTYLSPKMAILPSGNVGIGTTAPSAKLHVVGNILASGAITAGTASDSRLKSNIATLCNASSVLRQLRGVGFDWNAIASDKSSYFKGHDVGLIAQEVEPLIPSAIGTIWGEYKRLDYSKITPYLVEGWKEHDEEIQRLKAEIIELKKKIYGLEK